MAAGRVDKLLSDFARACAFGDDVEARRKASNAIRAAIAAAPQAPQWQPIETAPRGSDNEFLATDGEMIDKTWEGWSEDDRPVYVRADWVSWRPTLWMPLPALPNGAAT